MDRETAGEEIDSSEGSSDDETPGMTMRSVSPAQPLLQPSSDSMEEAEPDDLHSGAGALVPSAAMAGAAPDREPLTIQRASPLETPMSYSAARLRTERGVVELPAPPANIRMEASGEMSGHMTGVNYDMSHQYTYNVDRAFFTRGAMQEITRHLRSGLHPAIQSVSSSGTAAEAVARMLMPGQSVPAMSDLNPVIDAGEGADSTLPSALLDCKIRALKEDFVETDVFQNLERRLLDQGVAVVVGPTGEGKSSNAVMLCGRLRGQGYLCSYFESLHEIESHIERIAKCRRKLCVVIDNVFGTSILDTANLDRWSQVLSNLVAVQTAGSLGGRQGAREEGGSEVKNSVVVLLLSRDNVLSEALKKASNLPVVLRDTDSQISMKSADSLQKEEKRQLLRKYTEKVGKALSEEDENAIIGLDVPIGFPQVCRLYYELKTVHGKPVEFFSRPTALLLDTIKVMIREEPLVRTALALLVLHGGSLPLLNLQIPDTRGVCGTNTALQAIKEELGDLGNKGEACQELLKTFQTLCEDLLAEERGRVTFSHDTVRDAVCVALADSNLPFVAKHCSLAVLSQCILLDDSSRSSFCQIRNQSVLAVPRGQWPLFTKRLVSELEKGKFRDVFTCSFVSLSGFCGMLATECLKSNSLSEVVHQADVDCGLNFSFWASMASPNFLTRFLPQCKFRAWELWQGIIGCCVEGHLNLLRNMHQSLPEKRVEDWSVPISDWFKIYQREKGESSGSQSRCPPSSSECKWDNLPVGRHAIPGTVAAEHGHVNVLKTLIDLGMSADVRDRQQCTPLMSACSGSQKEVITFLVTSHKADLTAADKRGSTPLHKLAEGGHGDVACWLVEEHMHDCVLNACINKVNDELQTPLMLACRNAPRLATLLLDKGAEVGQKDSTSKSCLHYAAEGGNPGLLEKLLDLKTLDVNQMSTSGWSPLHFACSSPKSLEVVQILFNYGAEAKPRDKNSKDTPLHVAVKQGCLEVVQALVESSSDVIAACESVKATSPFLLACERGNLDIVQH